MDMRCRRRLLGALLAVAGLLVGPGTALGSSAAQPGESELVPHPLRIPLTSGTRQVTLWLEPGFEVGVAAWGLPSARMLAQSPTGELVLTQHFEGKVVKLADFDGDSVTDEIVPILTGLDMPHGVAFIGQTLFVAETGRILRLDTWWDGSSARPIATLPGGGHHQTRSLAAGPDGMLYVSVGSSCDVCDESDPLRAAIWRLDPDGGPLEPYARGLRNAVGLTWSPDGSRLWATENERNELGEEIPPDEVVAVRPGGDYGWPACYGARVPTPGFGSAERCAATEPPTVELPAHSAPLGLAFSTGTRFPSTYRDDLFVALHGSAVRDRPVGYELARIPMRDGAPGEPRTFMRGWLVGDDSWGRPVGPYVAHDGTLYLTDDKGGVVYRVRPSTGARGEDEHCTLAADGPDCSLSST
jgi:glucose/arabinose dehydrogenase